MSIMEIKKMDEEVWRNLYDLDEELGRGAFGVTYRGFDVENDRPVAIKVIDIKKSTDKRVKLDSIIEETRILEEIAGEGTFEGGCFPYIACYFDSFMSTYNGSNSIIVISELVDGGELRKFINTNKNISVHDAAKIMKMCLDAMNYIHSRGYAHQDIKPENIMIDKSGTIKLIDFGLSCKHVRNVTCGDDCDTCKRIGGMTPGYSPRSINEHKIPISCSNKYNEDEDGVYFCSAQRHDIYSMGVVFYELLNGDEPYSSEDNALAGIPDENMKSNYAGKFYGTEDFHSAALLDDITDRMVFEWDTVKIDELDSYYLVHN